MNDIPAIGRLTSFGKLSPADIGDLITLGGRQRELRRGEYLRREGEASPRLYLLLEGWTASSAGFASGARQLLKVHMPGDMLGLPSLALARSAETIVALSPAVLTAISLPAMGQLFATNGRLAAIMFLVSQEERVMLMDRLAMMGCGSAIERVAGLVLQLHARYIRNHPDAGDNFDHYLAQHDLAELTGITLVHLNRTLQRLRQDKVIVWGRRSATILDPEALQKLAGLPPRTLTDDLDWLPAGKD